MASLGAGAAIISIAERRQSWATRCAARRHIADKTGRYWTITFIGEVINLFAVPAMALAGNWQVAALLVLAERAGRALRKPTVEAMLSNTTNELGRGWVYGVNTALDEIGATIGPLIIALVLLLHGNYRTGYALLAISALLALASLIAARVTFPLPARLEQGHSATARGFQRAYWMAMLAGAFFAAGLMSFELISYHLAANKIIEGPWIPVLLALATAFGVIASLVLGKLYDGYGMPVLLAAVLLSAMFSPLVFFGGTAAVVAGMLLWGIGYATQDTLLKAVIAGLLPEGKRNTAFGLFYAGYGGGWLVGSIVTGLLYDQSRLGLVVFAAAAQLASLPLFLLAERRRR